MSNELESARAMEVNLVLIIGADGVGYHETETESPGSTNPQ
jgi:hypothetical protein